MKNYYNNQLKKHHEDIKFVALGFAFMVAMTIMLGLFSLLLNLGL